MSQSLESCDDSEQKIQLNWLFNVSMGHLVLASIGTLFHACLPFLALVYLKTLTISRIKVIGGVIYTQRYVFKIVESTLFYFNSWWMLWPYIVVNLAWNTTVISLKLFALLTDNRFHFQLFLLAYIQKPTQGETSRWDPSLLLLKEFKLKIVSVNVRWKSFIALGR